MHGFVEDVEGEVVAPWRECPFRVFRRACTLPRYDGGLCDGDELAVPHACPMLKGAVLVQLRFA